MTKIDLIAGFVRMFLRLTSNLYIPALQFNHYARLDFTEFCFKVAITQPTSEMSMPKLRLAPEEMKGLKTEARFLKLARSLRSELPWIRGVRKSGPTDDRNGIDFIVYATPTGPGKVIKIPLQIKSSYGGVASFSEIHPNTALTVPVLALEEYLSDETARSIIRKELNEQRGRGFDFVSLFVKEQPRPKARDRRVISSTRESLRRKKSLKRYLERETKDEIRGELL
jgi:hypothetical protein